MMRKNRILRAILAVFGPELPLFTIRIRITANRFV